MSRTHLFLASDNPAFQEQISGLVQRLADTALGTPIDPEGDTMKSLIAAIIGLTVATAASPGTAYVAEVVTSIPVTNSADDKELEAALEAS